MGKEKESESRLNICNCHIIIQTEFRLIAKNVIINGIGKFLIKTLVLIPIVKKLFARHIIIDEEHSELVFRRNYGICAKHIDNFNVLFPARSAWLSEHLLDVSYFSWRKILNFLDILVRLVWLHEVLEWRSIG
jgi:hypothetical protein